MLFAVVQDAEVQCNFDEELAVSRLQLSEQGSFASYVSNK
jgi:hypothetical protein